ncbi:hypothetical protein, partial [Mesorhizobium sp. M8A.F.Ca.ET.021.01.1.1]
MITHQARLRTGQSLIAVSAVAVLFALAAKWTGPGLMAVEPVGMETHMNMEGAAEGSSAARPKMVVTPVS